jgi:hypothetical protein
MFPCRSLILERSDQRELQSKIQLLFL